MVVLSGEARGGYVLIARKRWMGAVSLFSQARENAMCSVAAYGVVQYILQLKDRNNGNILIDSAGDTPPFHTHSHAPLPVGQTESSRRPTLSSTFISHRLTKLCCKPSQLHCALVRLCYELVQLCCEFTFHEATLLRRLSAPLYFD